MIRKQISADTQLKRKSTNKCLIHLSYVNTYTNTHTAHTDRNERTNDIYIYILLGSLHFSPSFDINEGNAREMFIFDFQHIIIFYSIYFANVIPLNYSNLNVQIHTLNIRGCFWISVCYRTVWWMAVRRRDEYIINIWFSLFIDRRRQLNISVEGIWKFNFHQIDQRYNHSGPLIEFLFPMMVIWFRKWRHLGNMIELIIQKWKKDEKSMWGLPGRRWFWYIPIHGTWHTEHKRKCISDFPSKWGVTRKDQLQALNYF